MRITLTDISIRNLKANGKQQTFLCMRTPNFGVRVSQAGTKSFFVVVGRERKRIHVGKYPGTSLQEARRAATQVAIHDATPTTLREAIDNYLSHYVRPNYRERPAKEAERLLTKHTAHLSHLHTITTKQVTDILDGLRPSEANHAFAALRTFFNWCERRDLMPSPMGKLGKPHKETKRDRVLSLEELKKVWLAAENTHGTIVKLLILTGQRRGEITGIRREWMQDDILVFPASICKNKQEHTITLTNTVRQLLEPLLTLEKPYNGWGKPKAELDKVSGVVGWTLHDLRRTFSTNLGEMGVAPHVIDRLLNHNPTPLHRTYNRFTYLPEMGKALDDWQAKLYDFISP